jgi:ABC-type bacteriocin/lantibiotic exporter with double-glycine peptidase domain
MENNDSQNIIARVMNDSALKLNESLNIYKEILINSLKFIPLLYFIGNIFVIIMLVILGCVVYLVAYRESIKQYNVEKEAIENGRRHQYFSSVFKNRLSAPELRIYNITSYFIDKWSYYFDRWTAFISNSEQRKVLNIHMISLLKYCFSFFCFLLLLFPVINKKMDVGWYISIMMMIMQIQDFFFDTLPDYVSKIKKNNLLYHDINTFSELKNETMFNQIILENKNFDEIAVNNLSFAYENSKKMILNKNFIFL